MSKRHSALARLRPSTVPSLLESTPTLGSLQLIAPTAGTSALAVSPTEFQIDVVERLRGYFGIQHIDGVSHLPVARTFSIMARDNTEVTRELPYGIPRHVRALMLKVVYKARRGESLLELKGDAWEFVDDQAWIDTTDLTRVYRIGGLQILS